MSVVTANRVGENGSANLPATKTEAKLVRIVEDDGPLAYLMDTARFEHMQRLAQLMASGTLTPKHLRGQSAIETMSNCFRVANQAVRWGMDPFAVMDETYVVGGKLAYQGKLVAAVVNSRANLSGRLQYLFDGQGMDRQVTVIGRFKGEDEERTVTLTLKQAKTANDMWTKDPDQKLIYSGVVKWARRHCPEVVLGVLTDDDLERLAEQRRPIEVETITYGSRSDQLAAAMEQPASHIVVTESNATDSTAKETSEKSAETTADKEPEPAKDIELSAAGLPIHDGIGKINTESEIAARMQELLAAKSKLNAGEFDFINAKLGTRLKEIKSKK